MLAFLIPFALKLGVPERFAKGAVIAALVAIAVMALGLTKCAYDRSIISSHDAKVEAATAKADAKADAKASVERKADDSRLNQESQQTKEAIDEARREGRDPRAAYYECVRRQQHARAKGQPSPDC